MTTREEALHHHKACPVTGCTYSPDDWNDRVAATPDAPADGLERKPGRWAFLDEETGDWIEVKAGVVWGAALALQGPREDGSLAESDRLSHYRRDEVTKT